MGTIAWLAMVAMVSGAAAAEIKLIGSPGVRGIVTELAPQFETATGHKVAADFDVIAVLKRRAAAGEAFDIIIPGPELIEELIRDGKVAPDSRAAFGRTGIALAVRKGAPKPDISTPENLKRVLLEAKAVAHSKEGQSGVHFRQALERLGIAREMAPKLRAFDGSSAPALQAGDVDIAVGGTGPILEMAGSDFLGPLPAVLQSYVRFEIGVASASRHPQEARALVRFLMAPERKAAFHAKGLERD